MKLHSRVYGEGQPLVILHGLFGASDNWQTLGKRFADTFEVHLIDQRNHGHSPHSDEMNYEGSTENSIGIATGRRAGNAFNWTYDFNLKVGDGTWKVKFDDWMFLQPNGVLLNKATVTRWGFKLGTVYLSFSKPAEQSVEKTAAIQPAETEFSVAANQ